MAREVHSIRAWLPTPSVTHACTRELVLALHSFSSLLPLARKWGDRASCVLQKISVAFLISRTYGSTLWSWVTKAMLQKCVVLDVWSRTRSRSTSPDLSLLSRILWVVWANLLAVDLPRLGLEEIVSSFTVVFGVPSGPWWRHTWMPW
jgi:hypothetical protein